MIRIGILASIILTFLIVGCGSEGNSTLQINSGNEEVQQRNLQEISELEKQEAAQSVRSLMQSYQDAMDALDAEQMLTHFIDSPDFVYTRNGTRRKYKEFAEGSRNLPQNFKNIESNNDSIYVDVITHDVAIATMAFDETLTRTQGGELSVEGTIAWTAIKRNGKWLFIHGHSFREF